MATLEQLLTVKGKLDTRQQHLENAPNATMHKQWQFDNKRREYYSNHIRITYLILGITKLMIVITNF